MNGGHLSPQANAHYGWWSSVVSIAAMSYIPVDDASSAIPQSLYKIDSILNISVCVHCSKYNICMSVPYVPSVYVCARAIKDGHIIYISFKSFECVYI